MAQNMYDLSDKGRNQMTSQDTAISEQSRLRSVRHPLYKPFLYLSIFVGAASCAFALVEMFRVPIGYQWLLLASLTILSSPFSVRIPGTNAKISIGDTFYFTNVLLYGVPAGVITAAADAFLGSLRSRNQSRRLEYTAFNIAVIATSTILGGCVFFWLTNRGPLSLPPQTDMHDILFPLAMFAILHYLWNSGSVAVIVALESRKSIFLIWKESFLWSSVTYLAGASAAGFIAITMGRMSAEVLGVMSAVVFAVYYTYKTYLDKVGQLNSALHQVNSLAYYDVLTKLPNRVLFTETLDKAIEEARSRQKRLAVMFLDLDRFKRINDTFGHSLGDKLLQRVSERLNSSISSYPSLVRNEIGEANLFLSRFGGDEFTILWTDVNRLDNISRLAQHIFDVLGDPLHLDEHEIFATISIGISIFPEDGKTADALLQNADTAMYSAKDDGRAGYCFYSTHMNDRYMKNLALEGELRKAIERDELELFYQPKINTYTRHVTGLEALIRWRHESRGLLLPGEFIPLAEETGLIIRLGEWVLRTACLESVARIEAGHAPLPVAINLSCVQFRQKDLLHKISRILLETGMNPKLLELEITESTIMQNVEESDAILRDLSALGLRLSIDDFGTGYSSLSLLKQLTLNTLKIDRSFISELSTNLDDQAIVRAIIAMAHTLGLSVIAEGVETEEHMTFLRQLGCDELQGFMFSPPLPLPEIEKHIDKAARSSTYRYRSPSAVLTAPLTSPATMSGIKGRSFRVH